MTVLSRFYRLKSYAVASAGCEARSSCEAIGAGSFGISNGDLRAPGPWRLQTGIAAALAVAALVAGCAGPGALSASATPEQKEKLVAERAEARWAALIKGDLNAAYAYLTPATRATVTLDQYKGRIRPGIWRAAKAQKVKCDGDVCGVGMQITYDMPKMKGITTPLEETWIIENGTAWYVYR